MPSTGTKPDWRQAPPWAHWWAVDADGSAHWHQIRPVTRDDAWVYHEGPGSHNGWSKKAFDSAVAVADWTQTLCEYTAPARVRVPLQPTETR